MVSEIPMADLMRDSESLAGRSTISSVHDDQLLSHAKLSQRPSRLRHTENLQAEATGHLLYVDRRGFD
jgi:hypothetical protein